MRATGKEVFLNTGGCASRRESISLERQLGRRPFRRCPWTGWQVSMGERRGRGAHIWQPVELSPRVKGTPGLGRPRFVEGCENLPSPASHHQLSRRTRKGAAEAALRGVVRVIIDLSPRHYPTKASREFDFFLSIGKLLPARFAMHGHGILARAPALAIQDSEGPWARFLNRPVGKVPR